MQLEEEVVEAAWSSAHAPTHRQVPCRAGPSDSSHALISSRSSEEDKRGRIKRGCSQNARSATRRANRLQNRPQSVKIRLQSVKIRPNSVKIRPQSVKI